MKNLLISGLGNVGKYVYDFAEEYNFLVICAIDKRKFAKVDCPIYSSFDEVRENIDVIIDFSSDGLCSEAVEYAMANKCAFISGTTDLSEKTVKLIEQLSKNVPVCIEANFSRGVHILFDLVEMAKERLNDFDAEILEVHNKLKKDSPSGTAKEIMKKCGITDVFSSRAGTVAGVHTVTFYGNGEELSITHRAYDKSIFARGALNIASKILALNKGFCKVEELI